MTGWAFVAIIAIVVWGIVQLAKARAGITTDAEGNETYRATDASEDTRVLAQAEAEETRREIEQLRERLQVLERIATDSNTSDARERARIAAEIEALRAPDEPSDDEPQRAQISEESDNSGKEQSP